MTIIQSDIRCPICRTPATDLEPWLDIPVDVKTGRQISTGALVWCKTCDLGLMRHLPTAAEIRESYDFSAYYTHGQSHIPQVSPSLADRMLMKFAYLTDTGRMMDAQTLQTLQPNMRRVLDIGCGGGGFVAALTAKDRDLVGIEPDPRAREAAAARGLTVYEGTAEEIPKEISGLKFDLIILSHVLEHCSDPRQAIQNVVDLLAPAGILYCEVPNCRAIYFQTFSEISEMLDVPRHIHFFTEKSLKSLVESLGLGIKSMTHHGHTRHFSAGWRAWENQSHALLAKNGGARTTPRRGWSADIRLLARTAFAEPARKYDCVGVVARKTEIRSRAEPNQGMLSARLCQSKTPEAGTRPS